MSRGKRFSYVVSYTNISRHFCIYGRNDGVTCVYVFCVRETTKLDIYFSYNNNQQSILITPEVESNFCIFLFQDKSFSNSKSILRQTMFKIYLKLIIPWIRPFCKLNINSYSSIMHTHTQNTSHKWKYYTKEYTTTR